MRDPVNQAFVYAVRHIHRASESRSIPIGLRGVSYGLIVRHEDRCDALRWGIQALGAVKGTLSWLLPSQRRKMAMDKLHKYLAAHPHAGESA